MLLNDYYQSKFSDKDLIESKKVLSEFLAHYNLRLSLPVDIFRFASSYGFDIRAAEMLKYEGMIIVDESSKYDLGRFTSNKIIICDLDYSIMRDKFVVAYLFSKYMIEKYHKKWNKVIYTNRFNEYDVYDSLAMCIAAEIFMPEDNRLRDHIILNDNLSNTYNVELEFINRRFKDIGRVNYEKNDSK